MKHHICRSGWGPKSQSFFIQPWRFRSLSRYMAYFGISCRNLSYHLLLNHRVDCRWANIEVVDTAAMRKQTEPLSIHLVIMTKQYSRLWAVNFRRERARITKQFHSADQDHDQCYQIVSWESSTHRVWGAGNNCGNNTAPSRSLDHKYPRSLHLSWIKPSRKGACRLT